ncbi:MAG: hypothetical protein ACYS14_12125 [Planctomycetota bacterium]
MLITISSQMTGRSYGRVLPVDTNPVVDDVRAAFNNISPTPRELTCQQSDIVIPFGGHFQGIQQAAIGPRQYAIISGSSSTGSYLVLAAIEDSTSQPVFLKRLLGRPFKHAGGFQVLGDYLAVGIEDNDAKDSSKIWILDLSQLLGSERPRPVVEIERRGAYKRATAGAVGIARLGSRHLLLVATWDSATIDIYTSNGKTFGDRAFEFQLLETWDAAKADRSDWSDQSFAAYQNINLVVDSKDRVFMVGLTRTAAGNIADLFELKLDESMSTANRLEKLARRFFHCRKTDFRSGSGLAITDSEELLILSCGHRELAIERFESN